MSKLDSVVGVQGNEEYNEGFNAGINFVKTVIESEEFNDKLSRSFINKPDTEVNEWYKWNNIILDVLKGYNL